jgi:hypothetical protein
MHPCSQVRTAVTSERVEKPSACAASVASCTSRWETTLSP